MADAEDSKSSDRKVVRVQVPPRARDDGKPVRCAPKRRRGRRSGSRTLVRPMARPVVERRLTALGSRLVRLREDLAVAEEQLAHFAADADDARVRSLVSETAISEREHRGAERHVTTMALHRDQLVAEIQRLEAAQDDLLDRLTGDG